ncbi:MAG: inositol monophosphatase family protein [Salinivirgaceae bacterium]|jgi:myo-inositol-1(or 4)-monophosphatase|nr:inositol monophosphatase family protein [Salinivirgaceae bacterium]
MELNKVGKNVIELAKKIGVFISKERKNFSNSRVESKGMNDFVSYVDKEAEQMLVDGLKLILPESGFITEENTASYKDEHYVWIIDPLDGTTNFIHNLAPHAISIALQYKNETILGVVYELGLGEMFYSWKGTPVFCNKQQVKVSSAESMSDGLIATGFHTNKFERLPMQLNIVDKVVRKSHGLRRHGSAATDLAYVAAGRFAAFFEHELNVWDVAAGAFLVSQAGGVATNYNGEADYLFGREMLAGCKKVHHELLQIIKNEIR